jgi:hypothetical protein
LTLDTLAVVDVGELVRPAYRCALGPSADGHEVEIIPARGAVVCRGTAGLAALIAVLAVAIGLADLVGSASAGAAGRPEVVGWLVAARAGVDSRCRAVQTGAVAAIA